MKRLERLAIVVTELAPGGAERWAVTLAEFLRDQQREVAVFSLKPAPAPGRRELVERLEAAGATLRFLDARRWWHAPGLVTRLAEGLRAFGPDLVQSFLFHANIAAAAALPRAGCPLVTSLRVADRRSSRWWIEGRYSARADRIGCVSDDVALMAAAQWPHLAGRLVVLPNGVDVDRFAHAKPADPASLGLDPGRPYAVFIGRNDPQKNFEWLVDLWSERIVEWVLREEHAPGSFRWPQLLLVGDPHYRKAAMHRDEVDPIVGVGPLDNVAEVLAGCKLLVLPSRWEGLPNVVLEAMSAGRPVIANDVEGVRQALGPDAGPQIVPVDDKAAWEGALEAILTDEPLAQRLGQGNQERAYRLFQARANCQRYLHLYEMLLTDPDQCTL